MLKVRDFVPLWDGTIKQRSLASLEDLPREHCSIVQPGQNKSLNKEW